MNQISLEQINHEVADFLVKKHFEEREKGYDFYFMLMQDRWIFRPKGRLPFRTDEGTISISFWKCSDNKENYRLRLDIHGSGLIQFVAVKDSRLNDIEFLGIQGCLRRESDTFLEEDRFIYVLTKAHKDKPISYISKFIDNEKIEIDTWVLDLFSEKLKKGKHISNQNLPDNYDSNDLYAQMIRPSHFDTMLRNYLQNSSFDIFEAMDAAPETSVLSNAITGFGIWNYRGIKHARIDAIPIETKWIFITGENGYGKSSVLQAIAIGLWGDQDDEKKLFSKEEDPIVLVNIWHNYFQRNSIYTSRYSHESSLSVDDRWEDVTPLVAYGSSRLLNQGIVSAEKDRLRNGSVSSLFFDRQDLLNFESELIITNAYNKIRFDFLCEPFYKLIPNLKEIRVNKSSNSPFVEYVEQSDSGETYKPVRLSQLATGFRNLLTFIGDMMLRISANISEDKQLSELEGIVIIDELELHLHPKIQRALPKTLSEIFPKIQFIASTHSPIPLLGAPKESIILTVHRTKEAGITVELLDVDFSKLLPNAILTSPIFGFEDIIPESSPSIAEIETKDSYNEALANQRLKTKLKILKAKLNQE